MFEEPGAGLAPWNVSAHELSGENGEVRVDGRPLVFYHFHSLREYGATPTSRAAAGLGRIRVGVSPAAAYWDGNYPVSGLERPARLDAVPNSSRHLPRRRSTESLPDFARSRPAIHYRCSHDGLQAARIAGLGH